MLIVTWTYPDGTEGHRTLPQNWGNVSGITPRNAAKYGFARVISEIPNPPPPVHTYSKLRLYDALVSAGLWSEVKAAIEAAGQWERWELANDLATDYQPFSLLLSQLRQAYGDATVEKILSASEI